MPSQAQIEDRILALEKEVADLKRRVTGPGPSNWLDRVAGSLADEPEFDQVLKLGREAREADRLNGEQEH